MAAQCEHPVKPDLSGERWDKQLAIYAVRQAQVIDICKKIIQPL